MLAADISGADIDLVASGLFFNPAKAGLSASGDWRVWASAWEGEQRGGLGGSGTVPNLYGCTFRGSCVVAVPSGDDHFIYVQQPVATVTIDSASREYGLDNPAFTYTLAGGVLGDTVANVVSGSVGTAAGIGSDVGRYAITGNFTSAAGYRLQYVEGQLSITPATLLFTADEAVRYLGAPNPPLTGQVSGFRNGDTLESVFGSTPVWTTTAGPLSPVGHYPVVGGNAARNYVFSQAPGNATALQIVPVPQSGSVPVDFVRETVNTYVYDSNIAGAPVCAVNASMDDEQLASAGDTLSSEWARVRSRPNLTNCFESERRNSCGDF